MLTWRWLITDWNVEIWEYRLIYFIAKWIERLLNPVHEYKAFAKVKIIDWLYLHNWCFFCPIFIFGKGVCATILQTLYLLGFKCNLLFLIRVMSRSSFRIRISIFEYKNQVNLLYLSPVEDFILVLWSIYYIRWSTCLGFLIFLVIS